MRQSLLLIAMILASALSFTARFCSLDGVHLACPQDESVRNPVVFASISIAVGYALEDFVLLFLGPRFPGSSLRRRTMYYNHEPDGRLPDKVASEEAKILTHSVVVAGAALVLLFG